MITEKQKVSVKLWLSISIGKCQYHYWSTLIDCIKYLRNLYRTIPTGNYFGVKLTDLIPYLEDLNDGREK